MAAPPRRRIDARRPRPRSRRRGHLAKLQRTPPPRAGMPAARLGVAGLAVSAAAAGCTNNPTLTSNAFVVHVVAPDCEHDSDLEPLLQRMGAAEHPTAGWISLRRVGECGEPFGGREWGGDVLQVWRSDYEWHRSLPVAVQMGRRLNDAAVWAVGDDDRMRIDHRHIFLGTVDLGVPGGAYVAADAVLAALALLEDRQGCEAPKTTDCGTEWQYADLSTFDLVAGPESESARTPAKKTATLAP